MADERIGVLGSGDVGRALGRGFARHGWDVKLGTHSPERLQDWLGEVEGAGGAVSVGSFAEAAAHGDMAVLAVLGEVADVLDLAGPENFAGTLVLDATNPLDFSGGAPPGLLFCGTDSLGERIQASLPDASVVKCFNTVSTAQMVDPSFEEGAADDDLGQRRRGERANRGDPRRTGLARRARRGRDRLVALPRGARPAVGDRRREARHLETRVRSNRVTLRTGRPSYQVRTPRRKRFD
ncbi:NADPH-dependent F420 reductase [Halalkalicoccus salilacus]